MPHVKYDIGEEIEVKMPSGWMRGTIKKVMIDYSWTGRTHYEITSKEMITISSSLVIRQRFSSQETRSLRFPCEATCYVKNK